MGATVHCENITMLYYYYYEFVSDSANCSSRNCTHNHDLGEACWVHGRGEVLISEWGLDWGSCGGGRLESALPVGV